MQKKGNLIFLIILLGLSNAFTQNEITVEHSCAFDHEVKNKTFKITQPSEDADLLVGKIVGAFKKAKNFDLKSADCETVLATIVGNQRYLLYNPQFLTTIEKSAADKWKVYLAFTHAVEHHVSNYDFKAPGNERVDLELEADEISGQILNKLGASLEETLQAQESLNAIAETETHPYLGSRMGAIEYGWIIAYEKKMAEKMQSAADSKISDKQKFSDDNYGYFNKKNNQSMKSFMEAKFPYPPPDCNSEYRMEDAMFTECDSFGAVADKMTKALSAENYPYRFLSFPSGFVIVTQMEQYKEDGTVIEDSETRWVHYPKQKDFSWSIDYFSSLIFPNKGFLRVFVFIVTAEKHGFEGRASKEQAAAWHKKGVTGLPSQVASIPYSPNEYDISLLTYEFEVPESNHKAEQKCPCCKFTAEEHFIESKLKRHFIKD